MTALTLMDTQSSQDSPGTAEMARRPVWLQSLFGLPCRARRPAHICPPGTGRTSPPKQPAQGQPCETLAMQTHLQHGMAKQLDTVHADT